MKLTYFTFLLLFTAMTFQAQTPRDYAVEISAVTDSVNKTITFTWLDDGKNLATSIYRKKKTDISWGSLYKKINPSIFKFTDTLIQNGIAYEYMFRKTLGTTTGSGYIYAGINIPARPNRGRVLLIVESGIAAAIDSDLTQYKNDLIADGWMISETRVNASDKVDSVKQKILDLYTLYKNQLTTVVLIGHVPVPYSGLMNPDGHPDHKGAWPADGYYADMLDIQGVWTDMAVNDTTSATRAANKNWANDGKFDETTFPSDLELEIGRIDMYDMPAFSLSETELIKLYFRKNHRFRNGLIPVIYKGIIDDNFKSYAEGFSGNAWRNFPVLLGNTNYSESDYFTSLDSLPYIWSYGCGGGWYQGAGGIGNTNDFKSYNTKGIFTMLFGSYFGDWDVTNSFLRAPLAAPQSQILTNAWVGRPWWQFHHMALGEHIGYSTRLSQNNLTLYTNAYNFSAGMVHVALMGDPTLRMHNIQPPSNLVHSTSHGGAFVHLTWNASRDNLDGYHIYRSTQPQGPWMLASRGIVNDTTYTDNRPELGMNYYMVRAYRLENTPSGTYYNLSPGAMGVTVKIDSVDYQGIASEQPMKVAVYPSPASDFIHILLPASNENTYYQLYNLNGVMVYGGLIAAFNTSFSLPVNTLPQGVYCLSLQSGNKQKKQNIVIIH